MDEQRIATLEFYDKNDLEIAIKSMDMALALWDIAQILRGISRQKTHDDFTDKQVEAVDIVRREFYEILEGYGINLDDMVL